MSEVHKNLFVADGLNKSFNDLTTFALLSALAYLPAETTILSAVATWMGYNNFLFINTGQTFIPRLLVAKDGEGVLVACEGTAAISQMAAYIVVSEQRAAVDFGPGCLVQTGFYAFFTNILPLVAAAIDGIPATIPIAFCGHSLGGVIAQMLAVWFKRNSNRPVTNCVVFASPKPGNEAWISSSEAVPIVSIRRRSDFFPNLPPDFFASSFFPAPPQLESESISYGTLAREWVFDENEPFQLRGRWFWDGPVVSVTHQLLNLGALSGDNPQLAGILQKHSMLGYLQAVAGMREGLSNPSPDQQHQYVFIEALRAAWPGSTTQPPVTFDFLRQLMLNAGLQPPPLPAPAPLPSGVRDEIIIPAHVRMGTNVDRTQFQTNIIFTGAGGPADPAIYGVRQRPFWLFRGNDRELLVALRKLFASIWARDEKLREAEELGELDPGTPIIDLDDEALTNAFWLLSAQVDLLLGFQQRSPTERR